MNRELTINLRLTAATGENAKVVSQTLETINQIRDAATAATKAAESVGKSVAQMGDATKNAATGAGALKTGIEGISQSATTAAASVEKLATSIKKATEAQTAAATQAQRGQTMYSAPIGPRRFEDLSGPELMAFARRNTFGMDNSINPGMSGSAAWTSAAPKKTGWLSADWEKDFDNRLKELDKGLEQVNTQLDGTAARMDRAANPAQKFLSSVSQLTGGLTSLARSFVLFTAANDESTANMLKTIAMFEAGAQAISGLSAVVRGAATAWTVYKTAVAGAAAAQGISLGAGALTAFTAGAIGTTAAVGAGVGLAGMYAGNALQVGASWLLGVGAGDGFTFGHGTDGRFNQGFGSAQRLENPFSLFSSTWNARSSAERSAMGVSDLENQLRQREFRNAQQDARARRDRQIAEMRWREDSDQLAFVAGLQDPTRTPNWRDSFQQQARVNTARAISVQERLNSSDLVVNDTDSGQDREEKLARRVQLENELKEIGRERLSIAQQEAEVANKMISSLQSNLAQMGRGDIRQLANAIRAAEAGDDLSAKQIGLLRRNNIQGYDQQIQANEARINAANPDAAFIMQNQREKSGIDQINQNYSIAVNSEMVLKVQAEIDKKAPEWISEAMKFITKQVETIKKESEQLINQQFVNEAVKRDQQNRARQNNGTPPSPTGGWGSGP